MREGHKKMISVVIIIILLPYILTVFIKGEGIFLDSEFIENEQVSVEVGSVVVSVSWEEYLIGLLAKEIPEEYDFQAMKAQAIIIRTRLALEEEDAIYQEDYYTTEEIQKKWTGGDSVEMYSLLSKAIQETEEELLYYDGELAITPYHYLNNGSTRDGNEVFLSEDYPYLVSVSCPLDLIAEEEITMQTISYEDLLAQLEIEDNVSDIGFADISITALDLAGYVLSISVQGNVISGEEFRTKLALKSSAFTIEESENGITIKTLGNGHGLGLSQNTAHYMGLEGKTYEEILEYFFSGTELVKKIDKQE